MTVNIAAVGSHGHTSDQQAVARARALSVDGASDLTWWELSSTSEPAGLERYDGLWLTVWPEDPAGEALRRAAWQAQQHGVPVVVSPTEPPAWFAGQARARAAYRMQWQETQARAAELEAAEREPRTYVHQMRGPRYRWWRPILALAVASGVTFLAALLFLMPLAINGSFEVDDVASFALDPWAMLANNLLLASLIPATLIGLWVGFQRSPWRVFSVAGRLRWRWFWWCALVVTPLWAAYLAITWFVFDQEVLDRPQHWVGLLVVMALTTPLQAAGEEVAFRGGIMQGVGAWFRSPAVALVVTAALSTVAFAAAHGSADPWIVIELGSLAVAACWLAWRTGGIEAAIVLHIVNNLLVMSTGILAGGLEESFVDGTSAGSPLSAGMNVVATVIVTAVLLWLARRRGIAPAGWRTPAQG